MPRLSKGEAAAPDLACPGSLVMLRQLCNFLGLQVLAREYDFTAGACLAPPRVLPP